VEQETTIGFILGTVGFWCIYPLRPTGFFAMCLGVPRVAWRHNSRCQTYDGEVLGSTPGCITIKWLLMGNCSWTAKPSLCTRYNQHQGQLSLPSLWVC